MGSERAGSRGYWREWSSRARGRRDPGVDDLQGAGRSKMACGAAAAAASAAGRDQGARSWFTVARSGRSGREVKRCVSQLRVALVQGAVMLCC
jgi:hypothetical protein